MNPLATLPRRSWAERFSLALAGGLMGLGLLALIGWFFQIEALVRPFGFYFPIRVNGALALFLLGLAMVGVELGRPAFLWVATGSGLIGLLSLLQHSLGINLHIDEFLVRDYLAGGTWSPGRMSALSACGLTLASLTLLLPAFRVPARARLFAEAAVGSIIGSAGISTLLGYAAGLPAVYMWGSNTATSPSMAAGLLLLGLALLVRAWRSTLASEGRHPGWLPMPAVIACLTLTIILWIGLREREQVYLGAKTQTSMETLAIQISSELERQTAAIERLARNWGNEIPSKPVWEVDSGLHLHDADQVGGRSLAWIRIDFRTRWIYPLAGNEALLAFDHSLEPARHEAITAARNAGKPVISPTVELGGQGEGIVIYAPIVFKNELIGYIGAEYLYQKFFRTLIADRLKLAADYDISISIGGERVFSTVLAGAPDTGDTQETIDKTYTILDRRLRLTLRPSAEALGRERRHLPELALFAGFGITLLLGLSVHLARSARAGQRAAESSNLKLSAENEERRRVEARLKVSDERLRLALDSTHIGIFEWNVAAHHVYYSPGLWGMLGYDAARMPATVEAWQSLIHPDDLPAYRTLVDTQLAGTAAFIDPEYRLRARSGEWRWISTRAKTVSASETGAPVRIIGTMQDITARREAELALRASQAEARKLSLVASKTDNPVIISSPSGTIEWVNESFTRVMEYALDEVVGRNPMEFMVGPETDPRTIAQIRQAMSRHQGLATEVVNYSKSGRKYHLHLEIQPVFNESGQIENFIAIETDITARVETEAAAPPRQEPKPTPPPAPRASSSPPCRTRSARR
jgi:PAS domain S-box-containing protein